ncbi:MAG: hypothetical protein A3A29_00350 [Candidatus Ryanbacteria bacterium RIFCSPLOWO2_01_FULL_47_79]|uniref:Uncharacterized protein n=2 Tax=Candidatus Yanofskyibacteriota TaxID=1752733 RepID=A0A1F8G2J9_9BACT|nr:MAG: hypothetical protein A3F25_03115 [Candidatus Yanofskybacteria bacterium RIFCSPHIGHO2_12_FULL_45_19b]OGN32975.1 MAG: hypothetical protein A3I32_01520 [Candidatus Yanofskybacteria bacterium RIFCSPLOWO2_02_FULL_45_10]OGZ52129.1 MAG: hypothetical protein A3A29_00350 [Candidatus Ryanbacteria bacterium RIFCSPLOWO2_01_FULL_47_79]
MLLLQLLKGFVFERDLRSFCLFLKNGENLSRLGEKIKPPRLSLFTFAVYDRLGVKSFAAAGVFGVVALIAFLEERTKVAWLDTHLPFIFADWLEKQAQAFQNEPVRYSSAMAELVFTDFPEVANLIDSLAKRCESDAQVSDYVTGAYAGLELLYALEEDGFKGIPV